jgi:putative addiction module component (TIGR02574 family)
MVTLEEVLEAALALSDDERAELILILRDNLGDPAWTTEEIEAAWLVEGRRRVEAMQAGHEHPISAEIVDAELDAIIEQAEAHDRLIG